MTFLLPSKNISTSWFSFPVGFVTSIVTSLVGLTQNVLSKAVSSVALSVVLTITFTKLSGTFGLSLPFSCSTTSLVNTGLISVSLSVNLWRLLKSKIPFSACPSFCAALSAVHFKKSALSLSSCDHATSGISTQALGLT